MGSAVLGVWGVLGFRGFELRGSGVSGFRSLVVLRRLGSQKQRCTWSSVPIVAM